MKKQKLIPCIVALAIAFITSIPVFASTTTISLSKDQAWTKNYNDTRSKDYSYVTARCHSVYPASGTDNFEKIQVRILNSSNTVIMDNDYVTLSETASTGTEISIKEGYLGVSSVNFQFRGNTDKAASAVVSYDGK